MLDLVIYCTLGVLGAYGHVAFSNPTTYDQRQNGDVNVQVYLKDVQVVALVDSELLDDYMDYDYAYDYADFTLKPIVKPTTNSPSSVSTSTIKPWNTWPTRPGSTSAATTTANDLVTVESSSSNDNIVIQESTTSSIDNREPTVVIINDAILKTKENNETSVKLRINDKVGNQLFDNDEDKNVRSTTKSLTNLRKSCPNGHALDKKGRCRRIQSRRRVSLVPLSMMRLSSKLSDKGRFTVRKDLPIRVYKSEQRQ